MDEVALTGISEIDFKILLDLNAKSLGQICAVNKYAKSICDDPYFWKLRLKGYIIEVKPLANNLNSYLESLEALEYANRNAKSILIIAKVEKVRRSYPTDGIIYINGDIDELFNMVNQDLFNKLKLDKIHMDIDRDNDYISLESKSKSEYEIKIMTVNNGTYINTLNNLEAEQLVAYVLAVPDSSKSQIHIVDLNGFSYLAIDEYQDYEDFDIRDPLILRQGIWDTLRYYQNR
jgi:hypothetical protein